MALSCPFGSALVLKTVETIWKLRILVDLRDKRGQEKT